MLRQRAEYQFARDRVLINHYMNAWSLLPWHYPRDDQPIDQPVSRLDVRRIEPIAGVDPYAWKGIEQPKGEVWLRQCKAVREAQAPA